MKMRPLRIIGCLVVGMGVGHFFTDLFVKGEAIKDALIDGIISGLASGAIAWIFYKLGWFKVEK